MPIPRMSLLAGAGVVALLSLAAVVTAQTQQGPTFKEIEESLTCQCGCGLTVHSCNHLTCPSAIPLRAEIREQIALGKSRQEILEHFRVTYGELILAAPTTRGFNLLAWVLPFLALAVGLIVVAVVVRGWVARQRARRKSDRPAAQALAADPATASHYKEVLERELRELER